jgi:3-hydroxyisobutyrate dehydrogenase-like beta-hydroxyacid dehydrogenase
VLDLARQVDLHLPLAEAAEQLISRGIQGGYGDQDLGAMTEVLREKIPNPA